MSAKSSLEDLDLPGELINSLKKAAELLRGYPGTVRVLTHYDGDGLASAGIIGRAFVREGISFHLSASKSATPPIESVLNETSSQFLLLADLGTALVGELEERWREGLKVVILDHHDSGGRNKPVVEEGFIEVNPRFWGVDGTKEVSGATLSFLLALALREENMDLGVFGLAGASADKQLQPEARGINKKVAELLQERGYLRKEFGVRFPGETLERALYLSVEPYLAGLSGRSPAVRRFLKNLGIKPEWGFEDLPEDRKVVLHSALYLYLLKQGVRHEIARLIFREIYWTDIKGRSVDVEDIGYEINAAGRSGDYPSGIGYVMGDEESMKRCRGLRREYREEVLRRMLLLEEKGAKVLQNIQYIEVDDDAYAGALAGLGMQYLFDPEKPTLAVTDAGEEVRISARGTWYLVGRGLDLAVAMRRAAEDVGGRGGGHNIAAGATIPKERLTDFLKRIDEVVGKQING
ncbi:MAG: DHH family phosphoesterase [Thermoplasmata archaeon]|nr:DHH family phosphoesterase [Thermoplasmata archaeon]